MKRDTTPPGRRRITWLPAEAPKARDRWLTRSQAYAKRRNRPGVLHLLTAIRGYLNVEQCSCWPTNETLAGAMSETNLKKIEEKVRILDVELGLIDREVINGRDEAGHIKRRRKIYPTEPYDINFVLGHERPKTTPGTLTIGGMDVIPFPSPKTDKKTEDASGSCVSAHPPKVPIPQTEIPIPLTIPPEIGGLIKEPKTISAMKGFPSPFSLVEGRIGGMGVPDSLASVLDDLAPFGVTCFPGTWDEEAAALITVARRAWRMIKSSTPTPADCALLREAVTNAARRAWLGGDRVDIATMLSGFAATSQEDCVPS